MADAILVIVALAFAWNLGVHYTGAVMGMPYAAHAIRLWPALILIAILTIIGATTASHRVEATVGQHVINDKFVAVPDAIVIVLAAGLLTLLYNYYKIPTSTIQILVFCVVGIGLAGHIPIYWKTIGELAIAWACTPVVGFGLGYLFTRLLDIIVPMNLAREDTKLLVNESAPNGNANWFVRAFPGAALAKSSPTQLSTTGAARGFALRFLPLLLIGVGMVASFALGANDVSNATGVFILTHMYSFTVAGLLGGVAMSI